jgi:hypothetical protein
MTSKPDNIPRERCAPDRQPDASAGRKPDIHPSLRALPDYPAR